MFPGRPEADLFGGSGPVNTPSRLLGSLEYVLMRVANRRADGQSPMLKRPVRVAAAPICAGGSRAMLEYWP